MALQLCQPVGKALEWEPKFRCSKQAVEDIDYRGTRSTGKLKNNEASSYRRDMPSDWNTQKPGSVRQSSNNTNGFESWTSILHYDIITYICYVCQPLMLVYIQFYFDTRTSTLHAIYPLSELSEHQEALTYKMEHDFSSLLQLSLARTWSRWSSSTLSYHFSIFFLFPCCILIAYFLLLLVWYPNTSVSIRPMVSSTFCWLYALIRTFSFGLPRKIGFDGGWLFLDTSVQAVAWLSQLTCNCVNIIKDRLGIERWRIYLRMRMHALVWMSALMEVIRSFWPADWTTA